jgi:hypothetical protein
MSTSARPEWPAPQAWPSQPAWPLARQGSRAGRVLALVLGVLLLLPGLGLLGGGGILVWADAFQRAEGFVVSPYDSFSSDGYALVSDRIDLAAGPEWLPVPQTLGSARVEVTGTRGRDVFVGIASAADAAGYLDDVQRTVVDGLGFDGPATDSDQIPGEAPVGPPADQDFWVAQGSGDGTQEVAWDPSAGDWMFVIMDADGSAGVDVTARIGVQAPALGAVGWTVLAIGALVTLVAVLLLRRVFRFGAQDW